MKKTVFIDWLFHQGRFNTGFDTFIDAVCKKLNELGIPLERVRISFRTLHPQVMAWSCVWDKGAGSSLVEVGNDILQTEDYVGSPIEYINEHHKPFRQSLLELPDDAHSVLTELRAKGMTDYYACPIHFSNGPVNVATYATNSENGFSDTCIAFLSEVSVLVTPFIENLATRRLARNLLETYIGARTGRRILDGHIQRGDGEEIKAAIWFSDFRNFTQYTESLSLRELLETLNQYFEIVHDCVEKNGGEILRFIGDAMLIVFPAEKSQTISEACRKALSSAVDAQLQAQKINSSRLKAGKPVIEFGVGLHEGCVMYGNVGAPSRLDFTVMGTAVNRTARLEGLTKVLKSPILFSGDFNQQLTEKGIYMGEFSVKGVKDALQAFSVPNIKSI